MEEKSNNKDATTIDSTKKSLVLQILLLVLAIALGVTLAFHVFYVDQEDTTIVLRNPKFKIEAVSSSSFSVLTRYANISYTNTLLWSANVFDKLHQHAKDQSLIDSTFAALPEAYEYWIGTSIVGDFVSGQTIRFFVSLSGKIQIGDRKSPSHISCREVEVSCGGLRVENLQDSTQTGVLVVDSSKACVVISQDSTC
ncbi:hypothetical protein H5410_059819 [Solanum commersonii]|uniref:Late embryogenesis abundant protein LEA-2 subgroup domain-containing protein n=1 Tax=Solanum commersonii TaxID=4109 RepID=A0A9J5W3G6_SOLCO|nr:hypothetical protein H5410_059819 [Solanum commersonii]